jgi:hypothetical protein
VKRRVGLVDCAHALRGFGLIDGIARPPIRMPRLHEPFVLPLQLLSARAWPETNDRIHSRDVLIFTQAPAIKASK